MFYEALCLFQRRRWKIKINPFHSSFYERFIIFMAFKVAHTEAQFLYCALNRFMFFDENNESSAVQKIMQMILCCAENSEACGYNINNRTVLNIKFIFTLKFHVIYDSG